MILFTGEAITPSTGVPSLRSIAVQLGRITRWGGATGRFYSVLMHLRLCWELHREFVSQLLPGVVDPDRALLALLLHDAEEVATGDIPSPFKTLDQRRSVDPLQARIYETYYGESHCGPLIAEYVKQIDCLALYAEAHGVAVGGAYDEIPPTYWRNLPSLAESDRRRTVSMARSVMMGWAPDQSIYAHGALVRWYEGAVQALHDQTLLHSAVAKATGRD